MSVAEVLVNLKTNFCYLIEVSDPTDGRSSRGVEEGGKKINNSEHKQP